MRTNRRRRLPLLLLLILLPIVLAGCNEEDFSTTSASCAFILGDGQSKRDADVHDVIYPSQQATRQEHEIKKFVPCNSRNYVITDGTVKDANQEVVGDRFNLIRANTSDGTPIVIWATALWTLNQTESAMREFYNVCFKYQCASDTDVSGTSNNSTGGWNDMLGENFGPVMDVIAQQTSSTIGNAIFEKHDPALYKQLQEGMTNLFQPVMLANFGYRNDLFCASGSTWSDPANPGAEGNTFDCEKVRIVINRVEREQVDVDDSNQSGLELNKKRLENARAIYGLDAEYWLGVQDSIEACKSSDSTCIFNINSNGTNSVPVPTVSSTPAPFVEPVPSSLPQ